MQIICTLLQTDKCASTSPLSFYRQDALPDAQPTVSKHCRQSTVLDIRMIHKKTEIDGRQLIWLNIRCHVVWFFHWVPALSDSPFSRPAFSGPDIWFFRVWSWILHSRCQVLFSVLHFLHPFIYCNSGHDDCRRSVCDNDVCAALSFIKCRLFLWHTLVSFMIISLLHARMNFEGNCN